MDIPPATTPDPATIVYDEREELLREAAALGNSKAVTHYLQAGVNANGRNKINGWTSLHWAASRGHLPIVHLLLRHGADPSVHNFKKQTALDLTKSDQVRECLEQRTLTATAESAPTSDTSAKPETKVDDAATKLSITPNYLREPDLLKTWSSPDELPSQLKPTVLTEADRPAASVPSQPVPVPSVAPSAGATPTATTVAQASALVHSASSRSTVFTPLSPSLIRVVISAVAKGVIPFTSSATTPLQPIGHVLARPSSTLDDLVKQIQDELLQEDNATAFAHLYQSGDSDSKRTPRVSRLMMPVPYLGLEGLLPVPKTQWSRYTVGEVVLAEVMRDGCSWALLTAEIEV